MLADTSEVLTVTLRTMSVANVAGSRTILFTAFEPSGDAHAAPVIRALLEQDPSVRIAAWGGPRMREAGAEMIGITAEDGAMGLAGLGKINMVRRVRREVSEWSLANRVVLHVPVDSPAANFPVVKAIRPRGIRTVHLVAPQMWAWGEWRLAKLRRLTDLVLCLLPFEEEWFRTRGVTAKFVGHPVLHTPLDLPQLREQASHLPGGAPRILILPGSRSGEVRRNASISLAKSASGVTSSVSRSRWRRDRCLVVPTMLGCRLHRRATWQGSGAVWRRPRAC
jgi:lipid-A-disaccharide synthase